MTAPDRQLRSSHRSALPPSPQPGCGRPLVVPLGTTGDGPPLIFLHASDGTALPYLPLARQLAGLQGCVGVEAASQGGADAARGFAELADGYADAIGKEFKRGPYYLAGWSLGGAVAFAVATALRARRQRVALLALIDPVRPSGARWPSDRAEVLAMFADSVTRSVDASPASVSVPSLRGLAPREQDSCLLAALSRAGGVPAGAESLLIARMELFESLLAALRAWRPRRFDGRIDVLLSAERLTAGCAREWAAMTTGPTVAHRVDGDHYAMMRPPLVGQLAQMITQLTHAAAGLP